MEIAVGKDGGGRPRLHVAGASPINCAIDECAAPRVLRPARVIDWKHVDVPVEDEMPARLTSLEGSNQIWKFRHWSNGPKRQSLLCQEFADVAGRHSGVAGRVRAFGANEP